MMPETPHFMVRRADWQADEAAIAGVRREVFVTEQSVPEKLEWEALDPECVWFVALAACASVVGIVRLTPDARIGRTAVQATWRRRGVGAALLAAVLDEARRRGFSAVHLSAQTHAVPFYARFGFQPKGDIYQDAGIPHIAMTFTFEDL
jgi:predicted GNAT family N-acyltransferase